MHSSSDQQSSEEAYEVFDFLEYTKQKGKQYILIWWKGYPKEHATWQPVENLQSIPDFQQSYQKLKKRYEHSRSKIGIKEAKLARQIKPKLSLKQKADNQIFQSESSPSINEKAADKHGFRYVKQSDNSSHIHIAGKDDRKHLTKSPVLKDNEIVNIWQQKPPFVLQQQSSYSSQIPQIKIKQTNESKQKKDNLFSKPINDTQNEQYIAIEPLKFSIKIKESTKLMFRNEQLSVIKDACLKNNEVLYQVEFVNSTFKEPVYLHQKYLKLLWPRKFAQYLLSKVQISIKKNQ